MIEGTCDGACWAAPAATVQREGHQHRFARLGEEPPAELLRCVEGDCDDEYAGRGEHGLLERLGRTDGTFADAVIRGAYAALAQASAVGLERTLDAIWMSSYAARYAFPAPGKRLTVAAEDDSDTTFIDRHLLEGDPHRVLEGVLVAAHATGAAGVRVHLGGQPSSAQRAFDDALREAARHGILDGHVVGDRVLGGGVVEIEVTDASVEGDAMSGAMSIEAVSALSTVFDSPPPPTRLVGLSGAVPRPGVYEVPVSAAMTWTGVLAMAGATPAFVPGLRTGAAGVDTGAEGALVPREAFEEAVTPGALGNGAVVVLPRDADV